MAHCNGRIELIKEDQIKKIQNWEKLKGNIRTDQNYLIVTGKFVEDMANAVENALKNLMERVTQLGD